MFSTLAKQILRRNISVRASPFSKLTELEACRESRSYHEVSYQRNARDPKEVLSYRADPQIDDLDRRRDGDQKDVNCKDGWVRVEMMHAPWNPADVNTVQGRYPSPYGSSKVVSCSDGGNFQVSSNHCIGSYFDKDPVIGSEGWGTVTHSSSSLIPEGTLVTMGLPGLGTLRSSLWVPASAVLRVPSFVHDQLGPSGSSLFQLGGTALRLLSDFVTLQPGDLVLQNAGNSGVGFLAGQLAASPLLFGKSQRKTSETSSDDCSTPLMVSLIRRHGKSKKSFDETVDYLTKVGKNAFVIAEEDLFLPAEDTADNSEGRKSTTSRKINETAIREMRQKLRDLSPTGKLPKLALNAAGGETAKAMLKLLEPGSTMVTYGGMSGKGIEVPTPQLIFSDVRLVGYWHSRWMVRQQQYLQENQTAVSQRTAMINTLSKLVQEEDLKCPPTKVVRLEDLQEGLLWQEDQHSKDSSAQSPVRTKLIWDCSE